MLLCVYFSYFLDFQEHAIFFLGSYLFGFFNPDSHPNKHHLYTAAKRNYLFSDIKIGTSTGLAYGSLNTSVGAAPPIIYFTLNVCIYFVNVSQCCWLNSIVHFRYIQNMFLCGGVLDFFSMFSLLTKSKCNLWVASTDPLSPFDMIVYFCRTRQSSGSQPHLKFFICTEGILYMFPVNPTLKM